MKKRLITTILSLFCVIVYAQRINVATYNMRVDKTEDFEKGDGWHKRCPKISQMIRFHDFDVFGVQELIPNQLSYLLTMLPEYKFVGVSRNGGVTVGEYNPIFYKPDVLELLDNGTFWLSQTPNKPSEGWDAMYKRICTWAKFRTSQGVEFYMFNTHFDHRGVEARKKSAILILAKIKQIAGTAPIVLCGDFNAGENTPVYQTITRFGALNDSHRIAPIRMDWMGTANNFDPSIVTNDRLDYIFVSPTINVLRYGVLTDSFREITDENSFSLPNFPQEIEFNKCRVRLPSDHYPVMIEIKF